MEMAGTSLGSQAAPGKSRRISACRPEVLSRPEVIGPPGKFRTVAVIFCSQRDAVAVQCRTMRLNHGLHLAYCTNIHRGETWAETLGALEQYTLAVRKRV